MQQLSAAWRFHLLLTRFCQFAEDIGATVEQRSGEHGALNPLECRILLGFIGLPSLLQPFSWHVDTVLDMVEQAPCQGLNKPNNVLYFFPRSYICLEMVPVVLFWK
jgi:hypothetical protein